MLLVLLPLVLTAATLVAVARAAAQVVEEADQLRVALVQVHALRPAVADIGISARHLAAGMTRLGG